MEQTLAASAMDVGQAEHSLDFSGPGTFPICELPADVVRIILKRIAFKDRLALEMVSKGHRDILRDLESWHAVNLWDMEATDISESQFAKVLAKIQPGFDKALPQIGCIAAVLDSFLQAYREELERPSSPKYGDVYAEARIASMAKAAGFPYQQHFLEKNPQRTLDFSERALETCTILAADEVDWLKQMGRKISGVLFPRSAAIAAQTESSDGEKVRIFLNISGAKLLSPSFLAASIIVLSAAGYRVDFRMDKADDPPFSIQHTDILQVLTGGDCTFHVNLGMPKALLRFDLKYDLDMYAVPSEEVGLPEQRNDYQNPLAQVLANASSLTYSDSKAFYNNFLSKILTLAH